jgi:hypothetical protein
LKFWGCDFCGQHNPRLALLHPKAPAVHVFLSDRVACFGPEIIKFDDEAVFVEERCAGNLWPERF